MKKQILKEVIRGFHQRELTGVREQEVKAPHGFIITMSEEERLEVEGTVIDVAPAYKFLLEGLGF